jgi:mono/diheme cytochrome c family protein
VIEQYVSPSEFKRLMSALLAVIGLICIAILFAFLIVPGLRYQAHTSDESTVLAVQGESGWLDQTDYLPSKKQVIPPIDPNTVMTATPELLERGKAIFAQTCATCHGPAGAGDGPGGKGLNPPARNFTANVGWKNGTRIEDLYKTLEEGIKGSAMTSFSYLSKKDRMALIHYVTSLGAFDHGQSDPRARAALENLFASVGEVIPNRIPVRQAIELLVQEYRLPKPVNQCVEAPSFDGAVVDATRAAQTVSQLGANDAQNTLFARDIGMGAPNNGFAVKVDGFSMARWNQLRLCLLPH